ncbi:MAG TPA: hypothetical protein VK983_01565 [Candidatus Limnocylindrales bacterium]|nr:hypothetical protein [Candidatus Limnocylindrales bacterium]
MVNQNQSNSETIEVNMGEFASASDGEILLTDGLGPCIGLAIHDPETSKGYLAHSFGLSMYEIEQAANQATAESADPSKLNAWLSGGAITEPTKEDIESTKEHRKNTVDYLVRTGFMREQIQLSWTDSDAVSKMELRTVTGDCDIESFEEADIFKDDYSDFDY